MLADAESDSWESRTIGGPHTRYSIAEMRRQHFFGCNSVSAVFVGSFPNLLSINRKGYGVDHTSY